MMLYKNVLHFADYGSPYKGNFISSLEELEEKLRKENHTMFYLFPRRTMNREWANKKENVNFLTDNIWKDIKIIEKIVKENDIGIIHIHFFSFKTLLLFKIANVKKCKIVIHLHGMFSQYKGIKKIVLKKLFKNVDVITCSQSVEKSFPFKKSVNNIINIRNAIYFPRLDKVNKVEEFEKDIDKVKILIFGYNYYVKGVDISIEAIEKARKENDSIKCYISVSSNKENLLKNIVVKYGKIPSWIEILKPRNDVASFFKGCDIFISASRKEGFCYAIAEAAYSGCNIIASEISSQLEFKEHISNLFWFKSENTEELKERILECIEKKEENQKKMQEQKDKIKNEYNVEKWANAILEEYENIVRN